MRCALIAHADMRLLGESLLERRGPLGVCDGCTARSRLSCQVAMAVFQFRGRTRPDFRVKLVNRSKEPLAPVDVGLLPVEL